MKGLLEIGMEDGRLLLLKLGVALAVPIAGYLVSHLNFQTSADTGNDESATGRRSIDAAPIGCGRDLTDGLLILQNEEAKTNVVHGTSAAPATITTVTNNFTKQSPENLVDEDGLILQAVKQEPERAEPRNSTGDKFEGKKVKTDAEIMYLRDLVQSLCDRIRSLDIQMLEYYGSKEQDAAIRELEGELKLNSVKASRLSLKIESLKNENQRLKLQASEYRKIAPELDSARVIIKHLKRRMSSVHVQAREEIAFLEQKIRKLNDVEHKDSQEDVDLQNKLKRLKELEDEVDELGKENSILSQENMELAQRLAYAETSISTLEEPQAEVMEEVYQLGEANDNLEKEIEQLQADRCADVEELVYLRWLNACLRYELRQHQPPSEEIVCRGSKQVLEPNIRGESQAAHT
ncbi:protein CHUP1, chloroplastic-like isoform X2 [Musa acuminata AAA Group]|uniref:protein CHUP1, chloroplastic-like isoform X2 n=1 Tax=Musa acuminata AAA Group TaxID=214697 RepID=UPI0031DA229E